MEDAAECLLTLLKMVSKRTASNSLQDFRADIIYHCSACRSAGPKLFYLISLF